MTRLALGAKWGMPGKPGKGLVPPEAVVAAGRSRPNSDAKAAVPSPAAFSPKKWRRVMSR